VQAIRLSGSVRNGTAPPASWPNDLILIQVLYIMLPIMTVSSLWANWKQTILYSGAVMCTSSPALSFLSDPSRPVIYFAVAVIFNGWHLRRKKAMVAWSCVMWFLPYKFVLVLVNTASVYWTMWEYARFFARRHFKVTDDPAVVEVSRSLVLLIRARAHVSVGRDRST
jgi:hypothetical protein